MHHTYLFLTYHADNASAVFGLTQLVTIAVVLLMLAAAGLGHTGLEISQDLRQFRNFYAVFGFKMGSWQPLPTVVGVTLKYFTTTSRSNSKYDWNTRISHAEEIVVMLSVQGSATGFILDRFTADDVNMAIDFAHATAERFNVPVNTYLPANQFKPL